MSGHDSHVNTAHGAAHGEAFPWKHIIGFVLSLVLTAIAFWLVMKASLPAGAVITMILALAILQVLVQLLLFMHLTDNIGPAFHTVLLIFGFFIAICIVVGTIWILYFTGILG